MSTPLLRPRTPRLRLVVVCVVVTALALLAGACSVAQAEVRGRLAGASSTVAPPPVEGPFDYQIGGPYRPASGVAVVERDRRQPPAAGRYGICYVNAFQTQPEERALWTSRHPDLLLRRHGHLVADPDWRGEYLLDISGAAKRRRLAEVVGAWFDGCARAGYRAIEPDNLDSWTRSHGALTSRDALAFAALLSERAHRRGLAIAQKNAPEIARAARDRAHLDFAVAEECEHYRECAAYTSVYGRHVIEIEYADSARRYFTRACAERGDDIAVIWRDRDVVPAGRSAYRYEAC